MLASNANRSTSLPPQPTSRILTAVQTKTVRNAPKKKKSKPKGAIGAGKASHLSSRSNVRARGQQSPSPTSKGRGVRLERSPARAISQAPSAKKSGVFASNVLDEPVASMPPTGGR